MWGAMHKSCASDIKIAWFVGIPLLGRLSRQAMNSRPAKQVLPGWMTSWDQVNEMKRSIPPTRSIPIRMAYCVRLKAERETFPLVLALCEMQRASSKILNSDRFVHFLRLRYTTNALCVCFIVSCKGFILE